MWSAVTFIPKAQASHCVLFISFFFSAQASCRPPLLEEHKHLPLWAGWVDQNRLQWLLGTHSRPGLHVVPSFQVGIDSDSWTDLGSVNIPFYIFPTCFHKGRFFSFPRRWCWYQRSALQSPACCTSLTTTQERSWTWSSTNQLHRSTNPTRCVTVQSVCPCNPAHFILRSSSGRTPEQRVVIVNMSNSRPVGQLCQMNDK